MLCTMPSRSEPRHPWLTRSRTRVRLRHTLPALEIRRNSFRTVIPRTTWGFVTLGHVVINARECRHAWKFSLREVRLDGVRVSAYAARRYASITLHGTSSMEDVPVPTGAPSSDDASLPITRLGCRIAFRWCRGSVRSKLLSRLLPVLFRTTLWGAVLLPEIESKRPDLLFSDRYVHFNLPL